MRLINTVIGLQPCLSDIVLSRLLLHTTYVKTPKECYPHHTLFPLIILLLTLRTAGV